jgi:hypothetical protein
VTTILKSNFKFSEDALIWVNSTYEFLRTRQLGYNLYRTYNAGHQLGKRISWKNTVALTELSLYLDTYGVNTGNLGSAAMGPDIFVANAQAPIAHFPHIDQSLTEGTMFPCGVKPVLTRFNVVIDYNPEETMKWWEHVTPGHPLVGPVAVTETFTQKLGIKGKTGNDKVHNLGEPTYTDIPYRDHTAAFVRTDCAHSLSVSNPGFRLVITTAIDKTIGELLAYKNPEHN